MYIVQELEEKSFINVGCANKTLSMCIHETVKTKCTSVSPIITNVKHH